MTGGTCRPDGSASGAVVVTPSPSAVNRLPGRAPRRQQHTRCVPQVPERRSEPKERRRYSRLGRSTALQSSQRIVWGWTHGAFGATNGSAFYTLRFPSHWVFAGVAPTRQTSAFMSYETDAAAYIDEPEGYPRVTGEDGSPRCRDLASEVDRKRSKCNAGGVCIHRRPNPHGTASQTRRGNQPR